MNGAAPQSEIDPSWRRLPWLGLAVLAVALLLAWAVSSAIGYSRYGTAGVAAASIAAGVCLVSAAGALCVTAVLSGAQAVAGLLLGILLRTGVPLIAGMLISVSSRTLFEAGIFGFILVHYFVALAVETPLAVRVVRQRTATGSAA